MHAYVFIFNAGVIQVLTLSGSFSGVCGLGVTAVVYFNVFREGIYSGSILAFFISVSIQEIRVRAAAQRLAVE